MIYTIDEKIEILENRVRVLELMLYHEAGGTGYYPAIEQKTSMDRKFYDRIQSNIIGIRKEIGEN